MRKNKYNAAKTTIDGIEFASKREAKRYSDLKLLQRAGEISNLELQPSFPITINGQKVCTYKADFQYMTPNGMIVEDVKGFKTPAYRLKKKLVEAVYQGVKITEIS